MAIDDRPFGSGGSLWGDFLPCVAKRNRSESLATILIHGRYGGGQGPGPRPVERANRRLRNGQVCLTQQELAEQDWVDNWKNIEPARLPMI